MKKLQRASKKLFVHKETIANLNDFEMNHARGGSQTHLEANCNNTKPDTNKPTDQ